LPFAPASSKVPCPRRIAASFVCAGCLGANARLLVRVMVGMMARLIARLMARLMASVAMNIQSRVSAGFDGERLDRREAAVAAAEVAATHAAVVDGEARFPQEAIAALREGRLLSPMIPTVLGGDGATLSEIVDICYVLPYAPGGRVAAPPRA